MAGNGTMREQNGVASIVVQEVMVGSNSSASLGIFSPRKLHGFQVTQPKVAVINVTGLVTWPVSGVRVLFSVIEIKLLSAIKSGQSHARGK